MGFKQVRWLAIRIRRWSLINITGVNKALHVHSDCSSGATNSQSYFTIV